MDGSGANMQSLAAMMGLNPQSAMAMFQGGQFGSPASHNDKFPGVSGPGPNGESGDSHRPDGGGGFSATHPWNPADPKLVQDTKYGTSPGNASDGGATDAWRRMGFARDDGFGNPINMERYGVGSPQWQIQTPFGFRQYGGPDVPHDQFGDFSSLGQNLGAMTALSNPYMKGDGTGAVGQSMLGMLGQNNSAMGQAMNSGLDAVRQGTGGPISGSTRMGMMNHLSGTSPQFAEQSLLDSMYGKTANSAESNAYNMLSGDRQGTRQGAWDTMNGQNANMGQSLDAATMSGAFSDPNSNPFLSKNVDTAMGKVSRHYQDAISPAAQAQFARAGSFGGSAHQQTEAINRYNLGDPSWARSVAVCTDATTSRSAVARTRRPSAWAATVRTCSPGNSAARPGSPARCSTGPSSRPSRSAAGSVSCSTANVVANCRAGLSMAQIQNSAMGMMPNINQMRYQDVDALRQIGGDVDDLNYRNKLADYETGLNKFQYQEDILARLSQGLGPMLNSTGVQGGYSNGSAPFDWAGAIGGLAPSLGD